MRDVHIYTETADLKVEELEIECNIGTILSHLNDFIAILKYLLYTWSQGTKCLGVSRDLDIFDIIKILRWTSYGERLPHAEIIFKEIIFYKPLVLIIYI